MVTQMKTSLNETTTYETIRYNRFEIEEFEFEYGKSKNKFNYRNKQILPNTSGTSLPSRF